MAEENNALSFSKIPGEHQTRRRTTMTRLFNILLTGTILLASASVAMSQEGRGNGQWYGGSSAQEDMRFVPSTETGRYVAPKPSAKTDPRTYGRDDGNIYHRLNRTADWE
jgi:hypothetical protein